MTDSAYLSAKRLQADIVQLLAGAQQDELPKDVRQLATDVKRRASDVRLDIRDYEFADTRAEQVAKGNAARELLLTLRESILQTSQYGIFGPIDVVCLSAAIDHILGQLE